MGSMTVRKLDDAVIRDVRISAAKRGVSMEQEARDRLGRPLPDGTEAKPHSSGERTWHPKLSKEEILERVRKLPKVEFDQKEVTDRLYDYLDEI